MIHVPEVTLAWPWVWTAVSEWQFWHSRVPLVVCFSLPGRIYNQVLGGLSLLNLEVYSCFLLEDNCAAWHVVSFAATALHGILKTTVDAVSWFDVEQSELQTEMGDFFFFLKKKYINYKLKNCRNVHGWDIGEYEPCILVETCGPKCLMCSGKPSQNNR